jgi:hypothetical protein
VSGIPASQFGVTFKGTPRRFGGTLALLGNFRTRWGGVYSPSSNYCAGFSIGLPVDCSIWGMPLSPIGGAFGGVASERASIYPGAPTPTFFDLTLWGFPWSTGTVTARAPFGLAGPLRAGRDQQPRLQGHRSKDAGRSGQHPARNALRHPLHGGPLRFAPRDRLSGGCRHRRSAIRSGARGTLDAREWTHGPRRPVDAFEAGRIDAERPFAQTAQTSFCPALVGQRESSCHFERCERSAARLKSQPHGTLTSPIPGRESVSGVSR